jgi:hypothetical protein
MNKRISIFLLRALWLTVYAPAKAQEIRVNATIDTTQVLIGDQFRLRLELNQPAGTRISFPQTGDTLSRSVEVISSSPLDTFRLDKEEQIRIIRDLTITSFDTGRQVIPALRFELKSVNPPRTIETLPVEFYVHTLPIDTTKGPTDIKKPYAAPLTLQEVSPYILGIILLGALVFFLFYYLHRRKKNRPVFGKAGKPQDPPHVVALRMLDRIKEEKLWQQNKVKAYYSEISDTLRVYMQDRFGIQAMEYTTEETLIAFQENKQLITEKSFADLKSILTLADLVKFAKYEPLPDDHHMTLMNAYFFVNDTKQEERKAAEPAEDDREGEDVDLK